MNYHYVPPRFPKKLCNIVQEPILGMIQLGLDIWSNFAVRQSLLVVYHGCPGSEKNYLYPTGG